ncbi:uncharacterized protein LOC121410641 [Lytechinus variegatus]|uniref:uncharacterized protein LOC121410641 n=1 Tax=Lytechinus variegatus TaxID=7654 RepID=UPI001BB1BBEF|nr:uncharacterized protein LOC121410641 [Lytechinus variegatus]
MAVDEDKTRSRIKFGSSKANARPMTRVAINHRFVVSVMTTIVVTVLVFMIHGSVVEGQFERGPTRRSAFMELARFENCGISATPIAELYATTRLGCAMRCLENNDCVSYEFNEVNTTCNLHEVSALLNLEAKYGYTYADGVNPNVGEQHPCAADPCNEGNLCIEECVPNGFTCECPEGLMGTYCDALAPVNGGFTPWGDYSECSDTCHQTRYRNCTNPRVVARGKDCEGPNTGVRDCGVPCTVFPHINCISTSDFKNDYNAVEVDDHNQMTLGGCMATCQEFGYRFAGISGSKCHCARNMMTTHTDDFSATWECDTPCPGSAASSNHTCGGEGHVSIYATGSSYRGCYRGRPKNGVVVIEPAGPTTMAMTTTMKVTTLGEEMTTQPAEGSTLNKETTVNDVITTAGEDGTTIGPVSGAVGAGTTNSASGMTGAAGSGTIARSPQQPGTTEPPTTNAPTTTAAPTTTDSVTTPYVTTVIPYPGITVNECMGECDVLGFMYASLYNGTHCICHNSMAALDVEYDDEANCDIECEGGNDFGGGLMCGGEGYVSVYQNKLFETTTWTDWYSGDSPSGDGSDIETPDDFRAAKPWVCDNPVDIQCKTTNDLRYDETDDVLAVPCTLQGGINCTKEDQTIYFNVTINITNYDVYDINVTTQIQQYGCSLYGVAANGSLVYLEPYTERPTSEPTTTPFPGTTGGLASTATMGAAGTFTMAMSTTANMPLYLNTTVQCGNATVDLVETQTMNDSIVVLSWKLVPQENACEDYKIRLKCPKEKDKAIGCYDNSDVSEVKSTPLALDFATCIASCRDAGYRYTGLQNDIGECACGNSMANQETSIDQCAQTCGQNNEPCGGISKQAVYFSGCALPFEVNTTMMTGTLMHNNDDSDDYGLWFYALGDTPSVDLGNFTNEGEQLDFQVDIDLGRPRTISKLETKGLYMSKSDTWTGVSSFSLGYRLRADHDLEVLTQPGSTEAVVFEMSDFSSVTEHDLGDFLMARFIYIYVKSYTDFPALKLEVYGCAD